MFWDRVHPLIQGRIQLRDEVLVPVGIAGSKKTLFFVEGILEVVRRENYRYEVVEHTKIFKQNAKILLRRR